MITMNELVDLQMQQHIAQEIYRQQVMQRIPDPFPPMLPMMPHHVLMPPRINLPGVQANLQNDDLWKQFHQIGTEMIITKSGRRMFPSMRLSLSGLEDESSYCVLLEMVPIGDCRYKFSGSQWVPAGGAEPQSPQRMYLHPDSPATGAHWQAQPILFNKVKLTNNTLDNNGHIVLASMHKYQPRLHVIRTSDLTQIPWAPQQAFVFPETEFVAVTAYQNDRITKLKIDNNPFAKGFRETGQSRCKRKMSSSPLREDQDQELDQEQEPKSTRPISLETRLSSAAPGGLECCSPPPTSWSDVPRIKRQRSNGSACSTPSFEEIVVDGGANGAADFCSGHSSSGTSSPSALPTEAVATTTSAPMTSLPGGHNYGSYCRDGAVLSPAPSVSFMHHFQQNIHGLLRPSLVDIASSYFGRPSPLYAPHAFPNTVFAPPIHHGINAGDLSLDRPLTEQLSLPTLEVANLAPKGVHLQAPSPTIIRCQPVAATTETRAAVISKSSPTRSPAKRKGFTISAILEGSS